LLAADRLGGVPVLPTSAVVPAALSDLRRLLEQTVAEREAALLRLSGDLDTIVADLFAVIGPSVDSDAVDRNTVRTLVDALAGSAGVPAVVDATERAYRHRAKGVTGWPVVRWLRRLRPDPLKRLHIDSTAADPAAPVAVTSVPDPSTAQRSAVGLAVREVAARAGTALPPPWPSAITTAARSRLDDLPDALDRVVATTDLGVGRTPLWWRFVGWVQWLCTAAAIAGLLWLLAGYAVQLLGLPELEHPKVGVVPVPTLLLLGGLLLGMIVAVLVRPIVGWAARRARRRADARLRARVTEVARAYVVAPVREVLHAYAQAREALTAARGDR
jgi:hypothetical protein